MESTSAHTPSHTSPTASSAVQATPVSSSVRAHGSSNADSQSDAPERPPGTDNAQPEGGKVQEYESSDELRDEGAASDTLGLGKVRTAPISSAEASRLNISSRLRSDDLRQTPISLALANFCSAGDTRLVGIPAVANHLGRNCFFQDGYGGLEMLAQVERLSTSEKAMLFQFFDESDDLNEHILTPRADSLQGPELETLLADLSFRRQMASVLTEFDPENFAQRVFGTVSALRRVTEKLSRVQVELENSGEPVRDASGRQDVLDSLKREFQLGLASRDQRIANLEAEKTEVIRNVREDTLKLLQERDRAKRGLRTQIEDLRRQVEMEKSRRRDLESQLARSAFSPVDLMNFLGAENHTQVQMNWERLLGLLNRFRDGDPVDPTWRTVITVMTPDDFRPSFPAYVRMVRPDDDGDFKESDPSPPRLVDLTGNVSSESSGKSSSKKQSTSGCSSSKSKGSTKPRKAPLHMQDRPSGWISDSQLECRPDDAQVLWTQAEARQSLSEHPVTWEDLRMDLQLMMISGVKYPGAREWLEEDRSAHTRFELEPLVAMLVRMMFWNKLDEVFWTKYVPRRYYNLAESVLEQLFMDEREPEYWGPMVEHECVLVEILGPDDSNEQPDDKSKDGDFNPDEIEDPDDDDETFPPPSPPARHSGYRRLRPSDSSSSTSTAGKKRRSSDSKGTVLARRDFENLTPVEKEIIEVPSSSEFSWRHYGIRMKWSDPVGGHARQTPGLPDYSPNRYDVKILKSRSCSMDRQLQRLLLDAPWNDMYSRRPQELYFHTRDDLDEAARDALYDWTNFVAGDSRAFWHTYHWLTLDGSPSAPLSIRKVQEKRTNVHAVFRKRALALLTRVKSRLPDSIWFEPGVWNFPNKLCHWILMDPGHLNPSTGHPYTLEEQLDLLDRQEPGRAQWVYCSTDEERIAHVPDELRAKLIPVEQRIQFSDLWSED